MRGGARKPRYSGGCGPQRRPSSLPVVCSAPSSSLPTSFTAHPQPTSRWPPPACQLFPTGAGSNGDATKDGDDGGAPSASSSQPAGTADTDLLLDYDPSGTLWGDEVGSPAPALGDACLPFTRGALTFGSGMGVKMTVTRLQQVESWGRVEGNQGGISYALSYLSAAQSA